MCNETVAAGFDMAAERSGSATAGSTPDRNGLYLTKTGCPWALLPSCFGPWRCMITFVAGVYKGSGRIWIHELQRRRLA